MSAIHMAIEIAKTILFLFQMAILSNVHGRLELEDYRIIEMHVHPKNNQ